MLALHEERVRLYAPIEYLTTDIAITTDGPVVIEPNIGGAFTCRSWQPGAACCLMKSQFLRLAVEA